MCGEDLKSFAFRLTALTAKLEHRLKKKGQPSLIVCFIYKQSKTSHQKIKATFYSQFTVQILVSGETFVTIAFPCGEWFRAVRWCELLMMAFSSSSLFLLSQRELIPSC